MNGVRRYRNGQSSVAGFGVGLTDGRDLVDRVARWWATAQGIDQRTGGEDRLPRVVHPHDRWRVEGVGQHRVDLRDQPLLAVVVVEHEYARRGQVVSHGLECLLGEQERLEADVRGRADEGQRVGQGEDHQVVLLVRAAEERAAVVLVAGDPRIRRRAGWGGSRCRASGSPGRSRPRRRARPRTAARSPRPSRIRPRRSGRCRRSVRGTTCRAGRRTAPSARRPGGAPGAGCR